MELKRETTPPKAEFENLIYIIKDVVQVRRVGRYVVGIVTK
jgi:hypothetical protein